MRVQLPSAALIAAIALAATTVVAVAQDYPNRPVRVVIGPSSEVALRLVGERLHRSLGQPFVVESRPGGGGEVAAKSVSAADPDGYTLLYATSSYTLNTALGLATYDFVKEFEPVSLFGISSFSLVVHPSVPAKNLQELIALAKSKPGELNCASSGVGTPAHLGCEMFNAMAGVKTVHVPFRNVNAAVNAVVSGYVQMLFAVSSNADPQIQSGVVRGIGITTEKRSRLYPDLPAINESGLPGFVITGWGSMMAPAGTPKPVIEKLNAEIQKILNDPAAKVRVDQLGMEPSGVETPDQFRQFIANDIARFNRLIDVSGVKRGRPAAN